LIEDLSQFVESVALAVAINADPLAAPVRRIDEDLGLPAAIGSPATLG